MPPPSRAISRVNSGAISVIRREILWESETASDAAVYAKEIELIRAHRANDPAVGYNRWPNLRR
jgi:hypothetical protein